MRIRKKCSHCIECNVELNNENAYKQSSCSTLVNKCKDCCSRYNKSNRRRTRLKVIDGLGGKCECCGEDREPFLTLDHINNDGAQHRKSLWPGQMNGWRTGSQVVYREVIKQGFPRDKYRILCYNCNCALKTYPICPHKLPPVNK